VTKAEALHNPENMAARTPRLPQWHRGITSATFFPAKNLLGTVQKPMDGLFPEKFNKP